MDTCCNESESCAALIIGMYICFPFSDLSLDILPYQWIEMNLIFFDCWSKTKWSWKQLHRLVWPDKENIYGTTTVGKTGRRFLHKLRHRISSPQARGQRGWNVVTAWPMQSPKSLAPFTLGFQWIQLSAIKSDELCRFFRTPQWTSWRDVQQRKRGAPGS